MGIDQLVTGGDVDDPVVDSLTSDSVKTGKTATTNQEWQEFSVPTDREFGTWYQAPVDEDIEFSAIIQAGSETNDNRVLLDVNTETSGDAREDIHWAGGAKDSDDKDTVEVSVPADHYYRLRQQTGSDTSIVKWNELRSP